MNKQYTHNVASNLLITNDGFLKIADFGLARKVSKSKCNSVVCTLLYRPPELLLGNELYGTEIDIWSAGCIVAESILRKPLIIGNNEKEVMDCIYNVCGFYKDKGYFYSLRKNTVFPPPYDCRNTIDEYFSNSSNELRELIKGLLEMNPKERWDCKKALDCNYFKTYPLPLLPWQFVNSLYLK